MFQLRRAGSFFSAFIDKFNRDETTTLAASLAFYTSLSLAPLVILFVTISSQLNGELLGQFIDQVNALVGPQAAESIDLIVASAKERSDLSSMAGLFGVATLLVSSSLIFGEIRSALNRIFEMSETLPEIHGVVAYGWRFLKERLLRVGLALSFLFTLIVSLILSSVFSVILRSDEESVAAFVNVLVSAFFYIALFTLLFRYLPAKRQPWRRAMFGGTLTAVLFVVGKEALGAYLGSSAIGSSYGAAGSIVLLLVWVYYSALITFVGAQASSLLNPERDRTPGVRRVGNRWIDRAATP